MPKRQCAGGMPLSYLNTGYSEPGTSSRLGSNLMISEAGLARPSINHTGGRRNKRKNNLRTRRINRRNKKVSASSTRCKKCTKNGGFYPSVMGSFIQNASRLVPVAAVTGYRMVRNYGKTRKNRW